MTHKCDEEIVVAYDGRGEAIKAIIKRIGYGITWETAEKLIETVLKNWKLKP